MKKIILHPHPDLDQCQNLTISRESPLAHVYHVWSMSVNVFVSYPAQIDRTSDRMNDHITLPALAE